MYYLQNRYYDSKICRFINADEVSVIGATPTALTDKNLFAYCDNNPVMRIDEDGEFWNWLVGAVVGAVGAALVASMQEKRGKEFWGSVANGAVAGFVGGFVSDVLVVTGCSIGGAIIAGAVGGAFGNILGNITESKITNNKLDRNSMIIDAAFGAATGAFFGAMNGPQKSMMEVVKSSAGKKTLQKGITLIDAVAKTSARELSKIGTTFIEETLSSFTSWLFKEYSINFARGWRE